MPTRKARRRYCRRCDAAVAVDAPWPGFRVLWRLWQVTVAVMLVVSPILAVDALFLTPLALMIVAAGGLLHAQATEPPTCRRCKLSLADAPVLERG